MVGSSRIFFFDSVASAAEAMEVVLTHARKTKNSYTIKGITVQQLLGNGMVLTGEIDEVSELVERIPGVIY